MDRSSFYLVLEIDTREKRRTNLEDLLLTEMVMECISYLILQIPCGHLWNVRLRDIPSSGTHSQRGTESEPQSHSSTRYRLYLFRTAHTYQLVTRRHKKG